MNTRSLTLFATALLAIASVGVPAVGQSASQVQPTQQKAGIGRLLAKEAVLSVLTSKADTRKSKVGDVITAKTLNPLKLYDGTILPVGSRIVGRVTQVQPKSSGGAMLAVDFDRVERKDGDPLPVHGLLVAIAPAPSLSDAGGSTEDLPLGSGGDSKGAMTALTGTPINGSGALLPPIQRGSAIRGVILNTVVAADGSSVLQATDREIRLESGMRVEVGLAEAQ